MPLQLFDSIYFDSGVVATASFFTAHPQLFLAVELQLDLAHPQLFLAVQLQLDLAQLQLDLAAQRPQLALAIDSANNIEHANTNISINFLTLIHTPLLLSHKR